MKRILIAGLIGFMVCASAQTSLPKPGAVETQTFQESSAAGQVATCTQAKKAAQKWGNTRRPFTGAAGLASAYPEVSYSQCMCEDRSRPAGKDGIPAAKPLWVCAVDATVRWKASP